MAVWLMVVIGVGTLTTAVILILAIGVASGRIGFVWSIPVFEAMR